MTNININTDTLRRALEGNEEAREEVRAMLPAPRPTTGLLGHWAKQTERGDVLVISEKVSPAERVAVAYLDEESPYGSGATTVPFDDLVFPEQTTAPEDVADEEGIIDPRDLLKSRQYLDSDGCVWGFRTYEGNDRPHWHWRLEGSSAWDPFWYSTPLDGPWTEYKGQD